MEEELEGERELEILDIANKDERWKQPIMCGFMNKFSTIVFKKIFWASRYFVLDRSTGLWYFKNDKKNQKPKKDRPVVVKGKRFWRSYIKRNCIEIERDSKPFCFYTEDRKETEKWISKLIVAGGLYQDDVFVINSEITPEYAVKNVNDWKTDHVLDWLDFCLFDKFESFSIYEDKFQKNCIDGKKLLLLNDSKLLSDEFKIENQDHRFLILQQIEQMKRSKTKKIDLSMNIVLRKLLLLTFGKRGNLSLHGRTQLALNLSKEEYLMNSYLSPSGDFINELVEDVDDPHWDFKEDIERFDLFSLRSSPIETERERRKRIPDYRFYDPKSPYVHVFPVKLWITQIPPKNNFITTRRLVSPLLSYFPRFSSSSDTMFISLSVGPWLLEWNRSGLVIPRFCDQHYLSYSKEIDDIGYIEGMSLEWMIKRLSNFVCRFNTKMNFSSSPSSDDDGDQHPSTGFKNYRNSVHFLEELFHELKIKIEQSPMYSILELVKKQGGEMKEKMGICISESFRKIFDTEQKWDSFMTFETHEDLDKFVGKLVGIDVIQLRTDFIEEMKLLRLLDRAFWG